jgi:hypothetical protein
MSIFIHFKMFTLIDKKITLLILFVFFSIILTSTACSSWSDRVSFDLTRHTYIPNENHIFSSSLLLSMSCWEILFRQMKSELLITDSDNTHHSCDVYFTAVVVYSCVDCSSGRHGSNVFLGIVKNRKQLNFLLDVRLLISWL